MRRIHPITPLSMLIVCILLSQGTAVASMPHRDCRVPFVFDGADVNVVVLPYRSAADSTEPLGEIGQRLALLIKLDVLAHILDYGSIGAVQMEVPLGVKDDSSCLPEVVMPKLLGQLNGAEREVAKGHGVVFVWGILYEEENDIVVQTYARFLRREISEAVEFQAGDFTFSAKPTTAIVVFTPQLFRKEQLQEIEASYARADFVRKEPRDDAPGEPLPRPVAKCFNCGDDTTPGFQVEEKKGEWIHVRWMDPEARSTRHGWIHAAGGLAGQSLDHILPELSFIQGCVGYLRQRIAISRREPLANALSERAVNDLETFLKMSESQETNAASAVALQLTGIVQALQGDDESLRRSRANFDAAVRLTPYDANAITLASVAQIADEWKKSHSIKASNLLADRLIAAGTLADDPAAAIGNLRNFYRLLLSRPGPNTSDGLSRSAVQERLQEVERIRLPSRYHALAVVPH